MASILSVKNLSIRFDGRAIIKNLSFDLEKGETLAVIGPNGSGKTALLRALLGIVPYEGHIVWAGGVRVGYVPQKIDADRHLPITLINLLSAKASVLHLSHSAISPILQTVGITRDILRTPVGHLSGGQFQKALIAFALLGNPQIILFDEPTASLDQLSEEHVYELIHRLQDEYGMTTLLVSHDISVVYHYATKVLCINQHALCFGTPEETLTPGMLEKLYGPHKYFHHIHQQNS